jgi:serine/threonine protein kinase
MGIGASSTVWCCADESNKLVAVKLFNNHAVFDNEKAALEAINGSEISVGLVNSFDLTIVYELGMPLVKSLWTPRRHVASVSSVDWIGLLEKLVSIHQKGIVHRDIRLENIVILDGDSRWIDFGFAVKPGRLEPHQGSMYTASRRVLKAIMEVDESSDPACKLIYCCSDDIESLARTLFLLTSHIEPPPAARGIKDDAKQLLSFWEKTFFDFVYPFD